MIEYFKVLPDANEIEKIYDVEKETSKTIYIKGKQIYKNRKGRNNYFRTKEDAVNFIKKYWIDKINNADNQLKKVQYLYSEVKRKLYI